MNNFYFLLSFSKKNHFFHVKHMVLHKMFLEFLSRKKWFLASTATSCSSLFLIVYDILWSSKMFHHFFRTFFTCYSTRCLLKFLLVITISRIHCNFGFISMVYACYSTRCLLNLLEDKRFLHSMHVIALYVCWVSFSEKTFFSHALQLHVHHFSPLLLLH